MSQFEINEDNDNELIRPLGAILLDLEELLDETIDDHELQMGDILNFIYGHLVVHRPDSIEQYVEGGNPLFYYGSKEDINRRKL